MALLHCEFFGHALEKMSSLVAVVPEGMGRGPFPVLYLLHGLSDNHTAWTRRTSIERYVESLGLIVVMPDGHRSFYVNAPVGDMTGQNYEDHIIKDVVGFVDATLPTIRSRTGRALAGLSMGGFGSFMLALRHPDMFCAAASHSGALLFGHLMARHEGLFQYLLGGRDSGGPYDCVELAEKLVGRKNAPTLRFDCGREDFLIQDNRKFRSHLRRIDYPYTYKEYPGAHDWEYWDAHISESITFVAGHLRMPRASKR